MMTMQNQKKTFQLLNLKELKTIFGGEIRAIYYYDENGTLRVEYILV